MELTTLTENGIVLSDEMKKVVARINNIEFMDGNYVPVFGKDGIYVPVMGKFNDKWIFGWIDSTMYDYTTFEDTKINIEAFELDLDGTNFAGRTPEECIKKAYQYYSRTVITQRL